MNKTVGETKAFFKKFNKLVSKTKNKIAVCPSFPCIPTARETASKEISIGSQDAFFEEKGEFTGQVSFLQLKDFCDFVLLGHSDRRHKFSESNELINKKVRKALEFNFNVILGIGETLEQRQEAETFIVLKKQLTESLSEISFSSKILIAYEPVWAIGTGKTATTKDIFKAHSFIRKQLIELFGEKAKGAKILYGGSVKPENCREIFSVENVDGVLVGGASLNPKSFAAICNTSK